MDDLTILNEIGKFSKKNMSFLNHLKKSGIKFENEKGTKKHTVFIGACTVIFDYDSLKIKTKGKCDTFEKTLNSL